MNRRAGFTIVELIITITIMVILVTLSVVQLTSSLDRARDEERETDVTNIILFQESAYNRNSGSYFPNTSLDSAATIDTYYQTIDKNNLRAPDVVAPTYSLVKATNTTQTVAGILPKPTESTYVYQPLTSAGALCVTVGQCRKFNIYYYEKASNTVLMKTSKNQ
jgi:prepilin-type N-terminal cleavage/methylation domain-containing protein